MRRHGLERVRAMFLWRRGCDERTLTEGAERLQS